MGAFCVAALSTIVDNSGLIVDQYWSNSGLIIDNSGLTVEQ